jgi:hypothetical protein
MPLKLVLKRSFLVYDLIIVAITIPVSIFILATNPKYNYLYPYLVLFRLPHIFKPILKLLFKDEFANL